MQTRTTGADEVTARRGALVLLVIGGCSYSRVESLPRLRPGGARECSGYTPTLADAALGIVLPAALATYAALDDSGTPHEVSDRRFNGGVGASLLFAVFAPSALYGVVAEHSCRANRGAFEGVVVRELNAQVLAALRTRSCERARILGGRIESLDPGYFAAAGLRVAIGQCVQRESTPSRPV